ncbi:MAG: DUF4153 domain-containing protein [Fermentimonas sp.]|nr:DUF4153 domain-containing protein [Fermentimonas sp.]
MKSRIQENIFNSEYLELLYRADKKGFEKAFLEIYPEISDQKISDFWKTRLEYENKKEVSVNTSKAEILFLLSACAIAGFLMQIPHIFGLNFNDEIFYQKNIAIIILLGLSIYAFITKATIKPKHIFITVFVFIISAVYINMLPSDRNSDSVLLVFIHLPLMLWCLYGLVFIDFDSSNKLKRIDYIKYNGELAIMVAIILIAGFILTAVTLGLFSAIDLNIERFYLDYIVMTGLVSIPIVATYIIRKYPYVANKIAPIIANIFSPLVLITLIVYLIFILKTDKDPYNDREFLIIFNLMLLGVTSIVVFSISGTSINKRQRFNEQILLVLTFITLIIDIIAVSAIIYRLGEYGFTPNRTAVLGSNLLIFGNLLLIMIDLYKVNFKDKEIKQVELTIAKYLPAYGIWTVFIVFILPWLFGLK